MIDTALLDLMQSTVSWTTAGTLSSYGVPTWSTAAHTMRARIVDKGHGVNARDRLVTEQRGQLWCAHVTASTFVPTLYDRVTLPDGTSPPLQAVTAYPDETGNVHHFHVEFGY